MKRFISAKDLRTGDKFAYGGHEYTVTGRETLTYQGREALDIHVGAKYPMGFFPDSEVELLTEIVVRGERYSVSDARFASSFNSDAELAAEISAALHLVMVPSREAKLAELLSSAERLGVRAGRPVVIRCWNKRGLASVRFKSIESLRAGLARVARNANLSGFFSIESA